MMLEREVKPDRLETRTALLEQSIGHINQTLIRIERRLDGYDSDFKSVTSEFKETRQEMLSYFKWTLSLIIGLGGIMLSGFLGVLGVMSHGFHWI